MDILLLLQGSFGILRQFSAIAQHQQALEDILQGLGTIPAAFGVVLQQRFLKRYPYGLTPHQTRADQHCGGSPGGHSGGHSGGLSVSVAVYLLRMPNLDIVNLAPALIVPDALFRLTAGALLARLAWLLRRDPK